MQKKLHQFPSCKSEAKESFLFWKTSHSNKIHKQLKINTYHFCFGKLCFLLKSSLRKIW